MDVLIVVLLIAGTLCFGAATFNAPARVNLIAAGLLCWILTVLLPALASL